MAAVRCAAVCGLCAARARGGPVLHVLYQCAVWQLAAEQWPVQVVHATNAICDLTYVRARRHTTRIQRTPHARVATAPREPHARRASRLAIDLATRTVRHCALSRPTEGTATATCRALMHGRQRMSVKRCPPPTRRRGARRFRLPRGAPVGTHALRYAASRKTQTPAARQRSSRASEPCCMSFECSCDRTQSHITKQPPPPPFFWTHFSGCVPHIGSSMPFMTARVSCVAARRDGTADVNIQRRAAKRICRAGTWASACKAGRLPARCARARARQRNTGGPRGSKHAGMPSTSPRSPWRSS